MTYWPQQAEEALPLAQQALDRLTAYRASLMAAGMLEPRRRQSKVWQWRFWRPLREDTAFVVNLHAQDDHLDIVCGCASTAFVRMDGSEDFLMDQGIADDDITLREKIRVACTADEERAAEVIGGMYARCAMLDKDALLAMAKEKRRAFLNQFALRLKPLKFRKKGNTWTRDLEDGYYVMFNAQKSSFGDTYYFNVYIGKTGTMRYGDCYAARIAPQEDMPLDWQCFPEEELAGFLEQELTPLMEKIVRTPLKELGRWPLIWRDCTCERKQCPVCWVEKNLWEAKA